MVGDGRLRLKEAPDGAYDLIVLDAFSSDAVPVHLLTQEAFDLYARKLSPGGAIMVHVSNRYLDLEPVVAASADHLGWTTSVSRTTRAVPPAVDSTWVLVTGNASSTAACEISTSGGRPARLASAGPTTTRPSWRPSSRPESANRAARQRCCWPRESPGTLTQDVCELCVTWDSPDELGGAGLGSRRR